MNPCSRHITRRRSSSVGQTSLIPVRIDSAHSGNPAIKIGKPSLIRSKSTITPRRLIYSTTPQIQSETRAAFRPGSLKVSTGRPSRAHSKATPLTSKHTSADYLSAHHHDSSRVLETSPNRRKELYSTLDEWECLMRIGEFAAAQHLNVDITKPATIQVFVAITQALLAILCSSQPPLTTKNYRTEMPKLMKDLEYPIIINPSFLKTPNTPQHFQNVLSIWIYLLDLVDEVNKPFKLSNMGANVLKYYTSSNKEEAIAELYRASLAATGYTGESLQARHQGAAKENQLLLAELANKQKQAKQVDVKLTKCRQQRAALQAEREQIIKQWNALDDELERSEEQLAYNCSKLLQARAKQCEAADALAAIRDKNKAFLFTFEDAQHGIAEMKIRAEYLQKLKSRNAMFAEHHHQTQEQQMEIRLKAQSLIVDYNTGLMMSKLPESEIMSLKLNEKEVNVVQINKLAKHVSVMVEHEEKINQERYAMLDKNSEMLLSLEQALAAETTATGESLRMRIAMRAETEETIAQSDAIEQECKEVIGWTKKVIAVMPKALKKRAAIRVCVEANNEKIRAYLAEVKFYAEKATQLKKEASDKIVKTRKECDEQQLARAIQFKAELKEIIKKQEDSLNAFKKPLPSV